MKWTYKKRYKSSSHSKYKGRTAIKIFGLISFVAVVICFMAVSNLFNKDNDISLEVSHQEQPIDVLVDGEVITMDFEDYVMGVVMGEMPSDFEEEALKAQAIATRTYTYKRLQSGSKHESGADMCDDINHCQAFEKGEDEVVKQAVMATAGQIATYEGEPITALYHSTSGGYTEDNVNVFGADLPYLSSVVSSGEESAPTYKREQEFTLEEIQKAVGMGENQEISIISRFDTGRVETVNVFGITMEGKDLREKLSLYSANFTVEIVDGKYVFTSTGYGHGVGMSQVGADALAKEGLSAKEIIQHYYTGVEIENISW